MREDDGRTARAEGGLAGVGEELGTTAQQVRRTAAALLESGRVGPGDAARGAAESIDLVGAATAGAARALHRAGAAARARPWAVVAVGGALGAGVGLLGQSLVRRRRARQPRPEGQPRPRWGEALEHIWTTANQPAGRDPKEEGR